MPDREVAAAYREASTELVLQREHERAALVEALFTGVIADPATLGEATRSLGLPANGPYLVVAAETGTAGGDALPGIEAALRVRAIGSAWWMLPDQQVGVLALRADQEEAVFAELRRHHARIGVGPLYGSLLDTPQALRFARLALTDLGSGDCGVLHFDDHPLVMLMAAAPIEAARMAQNFLGPLLALPPEERDRLLGTLETWFAAGGSASATGRRLYVHPNTVRYRLRRIETLTERSHSDPRAVLEIGAALHAVAARPGHRSAGSDPAQ
ncbi:helix-turn-helix domain-containing protein [Nocardia abscessus]|uniref:PucR family transcriptional regulator n=1 Tax=Nocardia abscessus TaxID=120957 RepID=UPI00313BB90C